VKTAIIQEQTTASILGVTQLDNEQLAKLKAKEPVALTNHTIQEIVGFDEFDDYLLVKVRLEKKTETTSKAAFLDYLSKVIQQRKSAGTDSSYTARLFEKGINKIAQKVGEEAVELVIEAKDDNKDLFLGEAADLLFHFLVLLEAKEIKLHEVIEVLQERHGK